MYTVTDTCNSTNHYNIPAFLVDYCDVRVGYSLGTLPSDHVTHDLTGEPLATPFHACWHLSKQGIAKFYQCYMCVFNTHV